MKKALREAEDALAEAGEYRPVGAFSVRELLLLLKNCAKREEKAVRFAHLCGAYVLLAVHTPRLYPPAPASVKKEMQDDEMQRFFVRLAQEGEQNEP